MDDRFKAKVMICATAGMGALPPATYDPERLLSSGRELPHYVLVGSTPAG